MSQQRTIAEKISCTGIGLHSGVETQLTLRPARINSGIVFVRRHGAEFTEIPARSNYVSSTSHAMTLTGGGVQVMTVEHVLAALYALEIDNVRIELDGPEVPAMDGSAAPFAQLIRAAGVYEQQQSRATLRIHKSIDIRDGERSIRIDPHDGLRITYAVDFDHPAIRRQEYSIANFDSGVFERELAFARTFGFLEEVSALRRVGMALGGSLDNTVVLDSNRVINPNGLRCKDEFVRHKILDMIGDLSLLGTRLAGHVHVERGGHGLHHLLVSEILRCSDAWHIVGDEAGFESQMEMSPVAVAR